MILGLRGDGLMKPQTNGSCVFATLLLVTFFYCSTGGASEWQYCCTNRAECHFYFDSESVVKLEKGIIRVWQKVDCREHKDSKVDEFLNLIEYDCGKRMERRLYSRISYREGGIGFLEESKWWPIEPDTVFETFFETVCKQGNKK